MSATQDELRAKITSELGTADWRLLASHAESESLIMVDRCLDIVDVAVAVAGNETTQVGPWIERGLLSKVNPEAQARVAASAGGAFQFVVVAPYVLAQRIVLDS